MRRNEVCVEIPDPVSYQDSKGQGEEDDQEDGVQGVAPVQETQHRDEEEEAEGDVQIPDDTTHDTRLDNGT